MKNKLSGEQKNLKRKLEYHYKYFDREKISPDPLEFPQKFSNPLDIELSAFVASVFAYGNIPQILKTLTEIETIFNNEPYSFLTGTPYENFDKIDFPKHRFYSQADVRTLFKTLKFIYEHYGSLKYLFLLYFFPEEKNIKNSLSFFSKNLLNIAKHFHAETKGIKFMFPDPLKGSACKRMNLFLRWIVRKDELDFGLWGEISTSQLVIPVDTHVARISRNLKLTKRKNVSWQMAEEITEKLKVFDSEDPVKYDFAICHIGARKLEF